MRLLTQETLPSATATIARRRARRPNPSDDAVDRQTFGKWWQGLVAFDRRAGAAARSYGVVRAGSRRPPRRRRRRRRRPPSGRGGRSAEGSSARSSAPAGATDEATAPSSSGSRGRSPGGGGAGSQGRPAAPA